MSSWAGPRAAPAQRCPLRPWRSPPRLAAGPPAGRLERAWSWTEYWRQNRSMRPGSFLRERMVFLRESEELNAPSHLSIPFRKN